MPKLLLITDFQECTTCQFLESGSKSGLIQRCRDIFGDNRYQLSNYMLCVISDGEDWQVLHPVISDLKGGTMHPMQKDGYSWNWLAGKNYTEEERKKSHEIFTRRLRQTLGPAYAALQANVSIQNEPQKSSPRKSLASAQPAGKSEKKTENPDLETSRKIILENFEKFRKAYKAKYGKEFLGSDDQAMFFRNDDDLKKILTLINTADNRSQLIDLVNFYELFLGNPNTADILILGKNPGAAGIDTPKTDEEINRLLKELELRTDCINKNQFFPISSFEAMEERPWFPARLIFGHIRKQNRKEILPPESDPKEGILSQFINTREDACKYADKICSLDLVPYHTVNFAYGRRLIRKFGIDEILATYIKNAMDRKAVILCPYFGAVELWLDVDENLREYPFFYTTHVALDQDNPPQDGNLNINNLRHYSKIRTARTPDENCEPLFARLVELGWTRIRK